MSIDNSKKKLFVEYKFSEMNEGVTNFSKILSLSKLLEENFPNAMNKKDLLQLSKKIIDQY